MAFFDITMQALFFSAPSSFFLFLTEFLIRLMKWRPFIVLSLYFPPFNIHNAADGRHCEVGATLMPFVSLAWDCLRKKLRL